MENLNKLSFHNYKINEQAIFVPMKDIKQEFDIQKNIKLYLFKVSYVHKYHSKTNTFTVYLSPLENTKLPIIKAQIPLELLYTHKIIGNYDYSRKLEDNEIYIIKERIFRLVNDINLKKKKYYLLCYGYFINKYKNDNANTKIEKGIQEFSFTEIGNKKIKDRGFETYYLYHKNLTRIFKILLLNKKPLYYKDKEKLEDKANEMAHKAKFKEIPKEFFIENKRR